MRNKYSFQLQWSEEDNAYFASCPEFPGLLAHGDTPEEAIREAAIALEGVIEVHEESGLRLPDPLIRQEYSGQFRLRLPKSLHRQVAQIAEQEGVSLNTFAVTAIAEKVGAKVAKKDADAHQKEQYLLRGRDVLVSRQAHGWAVRHGSDEVASRIFPTKREAEDYGRNVARQRGVELLIQGRDGTIQERNKSANDPVPPRDKR